MAAANHPIRFVLVEPSHPGNIGAVARAMKNMGLRDLHLVRDTFAKTLRTSLHRRIPYPDEKVERKEDGRTATERLEERYATEVYERPRRAGKSGRPSTDTTQVPAATNIIPMPPTPPDEKTRQGK